MRYNNNFILTTVIFIIRIHGNLHMESSLQLYQCICKRKFNLKSVLYLTIDLENNNVKNVCIFMQTVRFILLHILPFNHAVEVNCRATL